MVILVDISEQKYLEQELIVNQQTMREMILRLEESQRILQKQKEEEARRLQSLLNKEKLKNQILAEKEGNSHEASFMESIDQMLAELTRSGKKVETEQLVAAQENIALAYMDSEGCILNVNLQFAGQFGYLREELIGRNFTSILAAGNVKQRTTLERLLRGDVIRTVFTYINKDGRLKEVLSVSMPIFDDQMKIIVFLPEAINIASI
jgi:PAS domain S-box-containing protein